jgi:hypothetical protein
MRMEFGLKIPTIFLALPGGTADANRGSIEYVCNDSFVLFNSSMLKLVI